VTRSFPIYSVQSPEHFGSLFSDVKFDEIAHAARFPALVAEVLVSSAEDEAALEELAEAGFFVAEDRTTSISLAGYGFADVTCWRAFVFLESDGASRLPSASRRAGVLADLSSSVRWFFDHGDRLSAVREMLGIGGYEGPLVMGIVNVTPDSFYEGSCAPTPNDAIQRAIAMAHAGCHIIDIGGASSRPGSEPVPEAVEIDRVVPVIEALSKEVSVPISIDTYRPAVAEAALAAGARIVNDIYGFRVPGMLELIASARVPAVLMHMKGESPRTMQENPVYVDVIAEITAFFNEVLARLDKAGGSRSQVILDPGVGFGKRYEDNLDILARLPAFRSFGLPVLIGHSRKSFIGLALGGMPPAQRLEGTIAATALAVWQGADIVRVHDVEEAIRAVKVAKEVSARPRTT
jgi:dihydropteroate synthase